MYEAIEVQHNTSIYQEDILPPLPCTSQVNLRQLLRQLEKEKAELEWQLKDSEWRLDQEATVRAGGHCIAAQSAINPKLMSCKHWLRCMSVCIHKLPGEPTLYPASLLSK